MMLRSCSQNPQLTRIFPLNGEIFVEADGTAMDNVAAGGTSAAAERHFRGGGEKPSAPKVTDACGASALAERRWLAGLWHRRDFALSRSTCDGHVQG